MFYYDETSTDIEDIIMDFLVYRKNKRQQGIDIQDVHDTAVSREDYKPLEIIQEYLSQEDRAIRLDGVAFKEVKPEDHMVSKIPAPLSEIKFDNVPDSEAEYMHLLYSDINKRLHKYIEAVINEYEYAGSPAFDDSIGKETIDKMVDRAVELASKDIFELNEIKAEMHRHPWTPHRVLKACIEALLLNELYYKRKLMYTSVPNFSSTVNYL